jgi:hypothetical protein
MDSESLRSTVAAHFRRIGEKSVSAIERNDFDQEEVGTATPVPAQMMAIDGSGSGDGDGGDALDQIHRYKIQDAFEKEDLYWEVNVRASRFEASFDNGILYRPEIVADMHQIIDHALDLRVCKGVMVKGPGGIGKSHSLINFLRKLIYGSNNKYLVTFIPDCFRWGSVIQLLQAICASCGLPVDPVLQRVTGNNVLDEALLQSLVNSIDTILCSMGKK